LVQRDRTIVASLALSGLRTLDGGHNPITAAQRADLKQRLPQLDVGGCYPMP
jgi:hypothetical protein